MCSFPGLWLPCLKQKGRVLWSDMKLPSVVPAEKQLSAMSGTQVCADLWREGDEDMKSFFGRGGRHPVWSLGWTLLSAACYRSGFRKKGSWTFENKHPALKRYLFCTASFSSTRKTNSRRFQHLPVLGREGLTAIHVLLWAAGAPGLFHALAAGAPCSASSLQFVVMRELHDAALNIRASSSVRIKKDPSCITATSLPSASFTCGSDSDEREVPSFI